MFSALECPCPPWYPDGTRVGTYDWSQESPPRCPSYIEEYENRSRDYLTEIVYACPEGFVFDTPWLHAEDEAARVENATLTLTCGIQGLWEPAIQPKCIREFSRAHVYSD